LPFPGKLLFCRLSFDLLGMINSISQSCKDKCLIHPFNLAKHPLPDATKPVGIIRQLCAGRGETTEGKGIEPRGPGRSSRAASNVHRTFGAWSQKPESGPCPQYVRYEAEYQGDKQ
jgi:hypothetical protein